MEPTATGAVTSIVASTARATRTAWSNITNARSKLTAAARRRIEMNKQTALARREQVLTPLILTQPSGLQGTAAECGQTGLGREAMDMERD